MQQDHKREELTMPMQTILCPGCDRALTLDIPIGSKGALTHQADSDVLTITPRVRPIEPHPPRPMEPFRPVREVDDNAL